MTQETLLDGATIAYEYDAAGNRMKKTVGVNVTNYTYDNGNQLTAVNGQTYTYDSNGNLTSNGPKSYVYNEVNQLIEVKNTGGSTIATFTYDDQGRRISMISSGSTANFHYSGNKVIYETDANNNIVADYTWDQQGHPLTMTRGGVTYYYHINGHGDVTSLTDVSGNVVAQYQYDLWGNIISQTGTIASVNPYRYASYRYDEATGLYYLMSRYYDSSVSIPLSQNLYAYTHNNPVMFDDQNGYFIPLIVIGGAAVDWLLAAGATTAVVGAAATAATLKAIDQAKNNNNDPGTGIVYSRTVATGPPGTVGLKYVGKSRDWTRIISVYTLIGPTGRKLI